VCNSQSTSARSRYAHVGDAGVARLSAIGRDEVLAELARRGLVRLPERPRSRRQASVAARGSVSELVAEQRR
jgi:hypothetical protein